MADDDEERVNASAAALYKEWVRAATPEQRVDQAVREPGPIALRARWHYLRGLGADLATRPDHLITEEQWQAEIDLESEGDLALIGQNTEVARDRFGRLRKVASHPVVVVQSLIGLGDAARHDDDLTTAESHYREAIALAEGIGFPFGVMRARLPLAYVVRRAGSAEEMIALAAECEQTARQLGDRVYIANAQVARGEALDLLDRRDEAVIRLTEALEGFAAVGSDVGGASAGLRLLDVHRRRRDADAILQLAPMVMRAIERTQQVQEAVDVYDVLAYAYLKRCEYVDAVDACRRGMDVAGDRYPRATAHLRMTEGLALRRLHNPEEAAATLIQAYTYFQDRPGDEGSAAHCLGHLADCAEDLGTGEAVELRMRAMDAVEQIRARQAKPRWQQEYRRRFDTVYRGALLTTVRAGDASAFAAVFESLWGRRLPGVTEGVGLDTAADPILIAQLIARNDQARRLGLATDLDRSEKIVRKLGQTALSGALPEMYADATDPALAASYRPLQRDQGSALLGTIKPDVALLLIAEVPGVPGRVAWLSRPPHAPAALGQRELTAAELALIDTYSGSWPLDARSAAVQPLAELIPRELRDLPTGTPWQLVPLERLWSIPWSALPIGSGLLGATADLLISPSLTLAHSREVSPGPARPAGVRTLACIGPGVQHHSLRGLNRDAIDVHTAEAAQRAHAAILAGGSEPVVVVAHGRRASGPGHYLELTLDLLLTSTELLDGTPPESLALLACWGARLPEAATGEPLTLATIALARGSRQILSTVSELGDSAFAAGLVDSVMLRGVSEPWPKALRWAVHRRAEDLHGERLVDWAALVAIGGW